MNNKLSDNRLIKRYINYIKYTNRIFIFKNKTHITKYIILTASAFSFVIVLIK